MDAVVAMEGAGPSGGTPKPIGALLASSDAVASGTPPADTDPTQALANRHPARHRSRDRLTYGAVS